MPSCELISRGPRSAALVDVVFLHGIEGDPIKTWTNEKGGFWPAWLAEESEELAVWSVGYEASASKWTGTAMPLFDRAHNILAQLKAAGIGDRPICWVTHSMGGVLVKQMLRNADSMGYKFRHIGAAARGVVFIATPHTGTDLATVAHYFRFLRISVAAQELQALSGPLLELNIWYRENYRRLQLTTEVFFENQNTKGVRVVDRGTADPGLEGVIAIGVDADHSGICKPADKSDLVYQGTKALIEELIRSAAHTAPGRCPSPPTIDAAEDACVIESPPDLVGLDQDQLRGLRDCIAVLRRATDCLADLRQTPRLANEFAAKFAQTDSAVDAAGDHLRALGQQVGRRSWPHRDWAFQFSEAERNFRRNSTGGYQSAAPTLADPIASLLRTLEKQYPSLFKTS